MRRNMHFLWWVTMMMMMMMEFRLADSLTELDANFRFLAMPEDAAGERYSIRLSKRYVQPNKINTDGSFTDITYTDNTYKMSKPFRTHGDRLTKIIQSYFLDHSGNYFYQNATTWEWVVKSWGFLAYSVPDNTDWNWWGYQIGVPRSFWAGLFLSRGLINDTLYDDLIQRYWTDRTVWDYERKKDGYISASNLANRGFHGLFEAYYKNQTIFETRRNQVLEYLSEEMVNKTTYQGEGVGADYCIHVHNLHVGFYEGHYTNSHLRLMMYNGGYGAEFLKRSGAIYLALHDSSYAVEEHVLSEFINVFLECHQYLVRGRTFEPTSVGRNIDDNQRVTYWASLDSVYKVARLLSQLNYRKTELENVITRYKKHGPTSKANALIGNRGFFASDMMVHHRLSYMVSVRMFSCRTVRPETWISSRRKNNPDGYYTGDGFVALLQDDHEFGSRFNEVFQYYDWEKIPGTTVEYRGQVPREGMERNVGNPNGFPHHISNAAFVGSVSDGMYGAAAMDYDRPTVNITLKKSWFFFDDEVVCLGSDIERRETNEVTELPIITTLNQNVQNGDIAYSNSETWQYVGSNTITDVPNAKWIHHNNAGYVFPNGADANIESYVKTANGKTLEVATMWMEHGVKPYAYIMYPGVTIAQTEQRHANPSVAILQQDSNAHIVYQSTLDILSMVVFTGPFSFVYPDTELSFSFTVDQACILMIRHLQSNNSLSITVSFPPQITATVGITFGLHLTGDDSTYNSSEQESKVLFHFAHDLRVAGKSQTKNLKIEPIITTTTESIIATTEATTTITEKITEQTTATIELSTIPTEATTT
ncbi:unnamed protein product [Owenia fusiformis]|uniref:Chondroitin AC lyase n=1 Tax=Owenia fusiformis TaxID=6347 RepID=A0A8S4NY44_OWEFU|nr:unnamed protein product [Owenia fusiformis]